MMNNEFIKIGLYPHNAESYKKVKSAFDNGEQIVGIVQATGTGKTFQALQLALDNKDSKITYIVPSNAIIEHIENIINSNPNLDRNRDFPNLEFRTYHSLINMSRDELKNLNIDLLILDEFHHIGAPIWGARVNEIIKTHNDMKIFGMTAYTVRDRVTPYERDMAEPNGKELFSNKIVHRYDLVDAMIDGVLPKPIYKSAYIHLLGLQKMLEDKVKQDYANKEEYREYLNILNDVKRRIEQAPKTKELVLKHTKPNGKYIYFCPVGSDINAIMEEARTWFSEHDQDDIVFYKSTSQDKENGKNNRDCFYNDKTLDGEDASNKLRIIFVINQYNEGVHSPGVDGVILGRATLSDIVYFEQIGRALSVREDSHNLVKEYSELSIKKLIELAKEKEIPINPNASKEEIINKLATPIIIDLSGNIEFIKELETNLKDREKEYQEQNRIQLERKSSLQNFAFDIDIENQDIFSILINLKEKLFRNKWEEMYELAKKYYDKFNNLEVPYNFQTFNGYDYDGDGYKLGTWIISQRTSYTKGILSADRFEKLSAIGMRFSTRNSTRKSWEEMFELTKTYYEYYGNLDAPTNFKTSNGIDYDENGVNIRNWIHGQFQKIYSKRSVIYLLDTATTSDEKEHLERINVLTDEQYYKLISIGLRVNSHQGNTISNKKFLKKYGIEDEEIILSLRKRSNVELLVIEDYLISHNLPVCENGKLHEMFFISGIEMKETYGFYKSELISSYISPSEKNIKR